VTIQVEKQGVSRKAAKRAKKDNDTTLEKQLDVDAKTLKQRLVLTLYGAYFFVRFILSLRLCVFARKLGLLLLFYWPLQNRPE